MLINYNSESYKDGYKDGLKGRRCLAEQYALDFGFRSGTNYAAGYRKGEQERYVLETTSEAAIDRGTEFVQEIM